MGEVVEVGEEGDRFRRTASCLPTTLFVCHNCLKSFPVNSPKPIQGSEKTVEDL